MVSIAVMSAFSLNATAPTFCVAADAYVWYG